MSTVSALPKFTSIARLITMMAQSRGDYANAIVAAEAHYRNTPGVGMTLRAIVAAGGTGDSAALAPFGLLGELVELQRTASVVGRLAQFARRVPFATSIPREITGASSSWAGQGRPIPATNLTLDAVRLERAKQSSIVVMTKELTSLFGPAGEASILQCIRAAIGSTLDGAFLSPEVSEVLDSSGTGVIVSPASITFGSTEIPSTGATAAQKLADLTAMVNALSSHTYPVWIMSTRTAMALAGTITAGGALQFPGITMMGGTLMGAPVITTAYMPTPVGSPASTENYIILIDAADLLIADDGEAELDSSESANLQMTNNPLTGGTTLVSLFQTASVGIRVSRFINWARGHNGAVSFMQVSY